MSEEKLAYLSAQRDELQNYYSYLCDEIRPLGIFFRFFFLSLIERAEEAKSKNIGVKRKQNESS